MYEFDSSDGTGGEYGSEWLPYSHVYGDIDPAAHDPYNDTGLVPFHEDAPFADIESETPAIREELKTDFSDYRDEVVAAYAAIEAAERFTEVPNYIATGTQSDVVRSVRGSAVIKLPFHDPEISSATRDETIEEYVVALIAGRGRDGYEQIITYNDEEPLAVVNEFVGDSSWLSVPEREKADAPDEHYRALIQALQGGQGIMIDDGYGNIMYDKTKGFTIIDYKIDPENSQSVKDKVLIVSSPARFFDTRYYEVPAYAVRFRDLCREMLGDEIAESIDENWERHKNAIPGVE